ncbi:hypothetical protein [Trichococcus ilyis]|jgi:hypothetical protein|uniref:Uncharacterized protein n=1 Tax=Trichococcus ilyis TaxID=640938 RepID=A0A143Z0N7_9LACT|nr:hypothetical protein [Trichococcus ilyis]CZR03409.1 Hypothetical protein TR210_1992 [Trichococcus ilyis]SEJ43511.1 hypothetical protein SAMN05216375_11378 [Trichococcus ilyis]
MLESFSRWMLMVPQASSAANVRICPESIWWMSRMILDPLVFDGSDGIDFFSASPIAGGVPCISWGVVCFDGRCQRSGRLLLWRFRDVWWSHSNDFDQTHFSIFQVEYTALVRIQNIHVVFGCIFTGEYDLFHFFRNLNAKIE